MPTDVLQEERQIDQEKIAREGARLARLGCQQRRAEEGALDREQWERQLRVEPDPQNKAQLLRY